MEAGVAGVLQRRRRGRALKSRQVVELLKAALLVEQLFVGMFDFMGVLAGTPHQGGEPYRKLDKVLNS